ncbi:MAG: hypothetical protein IJ723_06915 [Ruminococcus sp.]|nr:hypothetical protein [Ruminococcus sp.]
MTACRPAALRTAIISAVSALCILLIFPLTAFADAQAQFYIPDSAVPQGSQFTV